MHDEQAAANCRWAVPTLFLSTPDWVDVTDRPWSCLRDETPQELESTRGCSTCVRWEPRSPSAVSFGDSSQPLLAQPFFLDILS